MEATPRPLARGQGLHIQKRPPVGLRRGHSSSLLSWLHTRGQVYCSPRERLHHSSSWSGLFQRSDPGGKGVFSAPWVFFSHEGRY